MNDVPFHPTLNACLNALAGLFLIAGWFSIRSRSVDRHRRFMLSALASSTLFLCSYLLYHFRMAGMVTRFEGEGIIRFFYFFILLTHTPLAVLIIPFSIAALLYALRGDYAKHVRITCWLLPTWLYVAVTGVLIYLLLYIIK